MDPVREQYVAFLKMVDRDTTFALDDARLKETLYARGPATWELTAFDGSKHRLSDYRGKVVVLDFWFANCGWCIKSYPQVNDIARKYKHRGVVVFGMNTDAPEEADLARNVIREMALTYTNLKARPALPFYQNEAAKHFIGGADAVHPRSDGKNRRDPRRLSSGPRPPADQPNDRPPARQPGRASEVTRAVTAPIGVPESRPLPDGRPIAHDLQIRIESKRSHNGPPTSRCGAVPAEQESDFVHAEGASEAK